MKICKNFCCSQCRDILPLNFCFSFWFLPFTVSEKMSLMQKQWHICRGDLQKGSRSALTMQDGSNDAVIFCWPNKPFVTVTHRLQAYLLSIHQNYAHCIACPAKGLWIIHCNNFTGLIYCLHTPEQAPLRDTMEDPWQRAYDFAVEVARKAGEVFTPLSVSCNEVLSKKRVRRLNKINVHV